MDHLHDEMSDVDMRFLKRFEEIEKNKQKVDEVDDEGVKQASKHNHKTGDSDHRDVDEFHGDDSDVKETPQNAGEGDGPGDLKSQGQGEGEGEGDDGNNQGEDEGKDGQGKDGQGEGEGDEQGEGDGDDGKEGEGEGEEGEGEGDDGNEQKQKNDENDSGHSECDGDCDDSDDDDGEPCEYCEEKSKRQQQQEQEQKPPVAQDSNGQDIFIGSEIRSKSDGGGTPKDAVEYVAVVMGVDEEEPGETPLNERMIVVYRRDGIEGGFTVKGEPNQFGWGVRCFLTTLLSQEDQEQEQKKQDPPPEILYLDENGEPLREGDEVKVTKPKSDGKGNMLFPKDGIFTVRADCDANENGMQHPCLVPLNFKYEENATNTIWTYNSQMAYTFTKSQRRKWDGIAKHVHKDDEKEDEDLNEDDFKIPDEEEQKPLTKTQKDRFKNICERIFKKSEQTFGNTIEKDEVGPELPGGVWDGDEIAKVYEVKSRGVTYRVTISAERYE